MFDKIKKACSSIWNHLSFKIDYLNKKKYCQHQWIHLLKIFTFLLLFTPIFRNSKLLFDRTREKGQIMIFIKLNFIQHASSIRCLMIPNISKKFRWIWKNIYFYSYKIPWNKWYNSKSISLINELMQNANLITNIYVDNIFRILPWVFANPSEGRN